jgi:hypothetical protein
MNAPLWLAHARRHTGRIVFGVIALAAWWAVLAVALLAISGVIA